jgi:hypothetical protein
VIGYRDRTWCATARITCQNKYCDRYLTDADRAKAEAWWGSPDFPLSMDDLSEECSILIPIEEEKEKDQ